MIAMNEAWVPHSSLSHASNYYHCYATLRCRCPSNTPCRRPLIGWHVKLEEWTFVSPSDWCSGGWPTHVSLANLMPMTSHERRPNAFVIEPPQLVLVLACVRVSDIVCNKSHSLCFLWLNSARQSPQRGLNKLPSSWNLSSSIHVQMAVQKNMRCEYYEIKEEE